MKLNCFRHGLLLCHLLWAYQNVHAAITLILVSISSTKEHEISLPSSRQEAVQSWAAIISHHKCLWIHPFVFVNSIAYANFQNDRPIRCTNTTHAKIRQLLSIPTILFISAEWQMKSERIKLLVERPFHKSSNSSSIHPNRALMSVLNCNRGKSTLRLRNTGWRFCYPPQ